MNSQQMLTEAFESRMKKKVYHEKHIDTLVNLARKCLSRYSASNIHLPAARLKEILIAPLVEVSYFEAGVLLQMVKGAPLSSFEDTTIEDQIDRIAELERITIQFNEVAEESAQSAEREVKTKIQIMSK